MKYAAGALTIVAVWVVWGKWGNEALRWTFSRNDRWQARRRNSD